MPDGVHRQVHPAALGELLDLAARVALGQVDRLSAERARHLEALGHGVDRDDQRRAGGLRRLHRAEADRAEAQDRRGLALGQRPRLDRVVGGAHHVAGEQGEVVAQALGDLSQAEVRVGHQHLVGLGALERAERLAVAEDPAVVALVELLAGAEEAVAAGRAVGPEHAVADRDPGDVVAGRDHLANELVADDEARVELHPPVVDVEVRAADAAGLDADDRVVGLEQLGLGHLVDSHLAGRLEGHGSHRALRLCEDRRTPRVRPDP